jgi:hypothetical protein
VIELSLSSGLDANYRVIEPDKSLTSSRPCYKIPFINRKTRWQYTIHLQPNSPHSNEIGDLDIVSNDTAFTFTKSSVSNTDIVFVSGSPKALEENYVLTGQKTLKLTLKNKVKGTTIKENLPYPSTGAIRVASDGVTIYSDIFLTT